MGKILMDYSSSSDSEPDFKIVQMDASTYNKKHRASRTSQQPRFEESITTVNVAPTALIEEEGITMHTSQGFDIVNGKSSRFNALPRRVVHTYKGHQKGINSAKFFPKHGHLIASASNDTTIKIWDVLQQRQCIATLTCHSKGVRCVNWHHSGIKIASASFDKTVKLYDLNKPSRYFEWGNDKIPYVVIFHPVKANLILVGSGDHKIYLIDTKANEIVHTYAEFKGAVNDLCFLDDGQRFAAVAEDNALKVFDLHNTSSIAHQPGVSKHPITSIEYHTDHLLCQGNNVIQCFSSSEPYDLLPKTFRGHDVAGYGCRLGSSPDGKFVLSGDAQGAAYIWASKSQKKLLSKKLHSQPIMDCQWHPMDASLALFASWDGTMSLMQ